MSLESEITNAINLINHYPDSERSYRELTKTVKSAVRNGQIKLGEYTVGHINLVLFEEAAVHAKHKTKNNRTTYRLYTSGHILGKVIGGVYISGKDRKTGRILINYWSS